MDGIVYSNGQYKVTDKNEVSKTYATKTELSEAINEITEQLQKKDISVENEILILE
jgi:hypothetical protein